MESFRRKGFTAVTYDAFDTARDQIEAAAARVGLHTVPSTKITPRAIRGCATPAVKTGDDHDALTAALHEHCLIAASLAGTDPAALNADAEHIARDRRHAAALMASLNTRGWFLQFAPKT